MKFLLSIVLPRCAAIVMLGVLLGCTTQHTMSTAKSGLQRVGLLNQYTVSRAQSWRLSPQSKVRINFPQLSASLMKDHPELAQQLQGAFRVVAHEYFRRVIVGQGPAADAAMQGLEPEYWADFVLQPHLKLYKDGDTGESISANNPVQPANSTPPNTRPKASHGRFEISIKVIEPKQNVLLDVVTLSARSAAKLLNDSSPDEMFTEALNEVFSRL